MEKKEHTIKEVAIKLNISESEVRKIERNALKKILNSAGGKFLKDYLDK